VTFSPRSFQNTLKYENEEIVVVATLKLPFATCGEWRANGDKVGQRCIT